MLLLQHSAGQGPDECARAVAMAVRKLEKSCQQAGVTLKPLELLTGDKPDTFKSALFQLSGSGAEQIAEYWQGVMQWSCVSPFRPRHKRKNWFFSGCVYELEENNDSDMDKNAVRYQTCRASGAGGQHVNTADSAVQATHIATGISVRVESERSQHANKRLARILLQHKLAKQQELQTSAQARQRWLQHWELERGNPVRVFKGNDFR
ncbi:peptide chain release factor H [Corallincola platygyrae]|uniref:Peptide chain release factor H n=1 Tax=Corallincola platygyrae TaxID=1193278 RepID=A0ABW4XQN5_9GAMM